MGKLLAVLMEFHEGEALYETLENLRKTNNLIHSFGIDFVRNIFSYQKKSFRYFRNKTLNHLNQNKLAKKIFVNIADTGINL